MKRFLLLLCLPAFLLAGCGGSSQAEASPFCQSVSTVKADVDNLKALKENPSLSALQSGLVKLQTDVNASLAQAKKSAQPQVSVMKSSMQTLKVTLQQVKNKSMSVASAVPIIKTQAQVVSENWQALKKSMKCS